MRLLHWSYARKYQLKGVFDLFPDTIVTFRKINGYYFIRTMTGLDPHWLPTREHYAEMECLLNNELGTLSEYQNRRALQ